MARVALWMVAALLAAMALVAGCLNVEVPEGPYVQLSESPPPPSPQAREQVAKMDKAQLENEVLRLAGENDALRQQVGALQRDNKKRKDDKKRLADRIDSLKDQVKDLRKR